MLTSPLGSEVVVMVSAAEIVIDRACVAVTFRLSATCIVKLDVPAVVGVPVIAPVDELSDSPSGKNPTDIVQV